MILQLLAAARLTPFMKITPSRSATNNCLRTRRISKEVAIDSVTYSGSDGVLEINGDGTYTFSPNENFNGEVSLDVVAVPMKMVPLEATTAGITVLEVNDSQWRSNIIYNRRRFSTDVQRISSAVERIWHWGDVELVEKLTTMVQTVSSQLMEMGTWLYTSENFNGQVQSWM